MTTAESPSRVGQLSIWAFLGVVVVYVAVPQGLGLALHQVGHTSAKYGEFPDASSLWLGLGIPVAFSIVLGVVVVRRLGWKRDVLVDDHPVASWVWVVPPHSS